MDLTAAEEQCLAPKPPWTIDKVPDQRVAMLLNVIRGFEVVPDTLEGKFKLSQDKTAADVARVAASLEARGDPASVAVADAMRRTRDG